MEQTLLAAFIQYQLRALNLMQETLLFILDACQIFFRKTITVDVDNTVTVWLALLPHSKKVPGIKSCWTKDQQSPGSSFSPHSIKTYMF